MAMPLRRRAVGVSAAGAARSGSTCARRDRLTATSAPATASGAAAASCTARTSFDVHDGGAVHAEEGRGSRRCSSEASEARTMCRPCFEWTST